MTSGIRIVAETEGALLIYELWLTSVQKRGLTVAWRE